MLSERIGRMAAHLGGGNGGDADCKRKLTMATVTRRKVLSYMQRRDYGGYRLAVRELGIRPLPVFHSPYLPKVRPLRLRRPWAAVAAWASLPVWTASLRCSALLSRPAPSLLSPCHFVRRCAPRATRSSTRATPSSRTAWAAAGPGTKQVAATARRSCCGRLVLLSASPRCLRALLCHTAAPACWECRAALERSRASDHLLLSLRSCVCCRQPRFSGLLP